MWIEMDSRQKRLIEALAEFPQVELAVLFGSAAREEASPGSDVDIGVRTTDGAGTLHRLEAPLARAVGCAVDLVPLDESPPLLRFEIARDGKVLVERKPHAWSDFRARAMLDWWDWAPIARRIHAAAAARLEKRLGLGSP
jgi:predicted nucleotidyltransferase